MEYMKEVIAKGNIKRALEDDAAVDILTYLHTGKVVNTVLVVRAWYGKAGEMQNNMGQHEQMSKVCIHICINELQEMKAATGCYEDVVFVNKTYKVRTAVRILSKKTKYTLAMAPKF